MCKKFILTSIMIVFFSSTSNAQTSSAEALLSGLEQIESEIQNLSWEEKALHIISYVAKENSSAVKKDRLRALAAGSAAFASNVLSIRWHHKSIKLGARDIRSYSVASGIAGLSSLVLSGLAIYYIVRPLPVADGTEVGTFCGSADGFVERFLLEFTAEERELFYPQPCIQEAVNSVYAEVRSVELMLNESFAIE